MLALIACLVVIYLLSYGVLPKLIDRKLVLYREDHSEFFLLLDEFLIFIICVLSLFATWLFISGIYSGL